VSGLCSFCRTTAPRWIISLWWKEQCCARDTQASREQRGSRIHIKEGKEKEKEKIWERSLRIKGRYRSFFLIAQPIASDSVRSQNIPSARRGPALQRKSILVCIFILRQSKTGWRGEGSAWRQISQEDGEGRVRSWELREVWRCNFRIENENQAPIQCVAEQWVAAASIPWRTPFSFQGDDAAVDTESLSQHLIWTIVPMGLTRSVLESWERGGGENFQEAVARCSQGCAPTKQVQKFGYRYLSCPFPLASPSLYPRASQSSSIPSILHFGS
jgi:hypothetical protein